MIDEKEFLEPVSQVEDFIKIFQINQSYHPLTPLQTFQNDNYFINQIKYQEERHMNNQNYINYLQYSFESDKCMLHQFERFEIQSYQPCLFQTESCEFYDQHSSGLDQVNFKSTELTKKIEPYNKQARKTKIDRYLNKKQKRVWQRKVSYDCRKIVADNRIRVKGRFVKFENTTETFEEEKTVNFIQSQHLQNIKKISQNPEISQEKGSYKQLKVLKLSKKRNSK